MMPVLHFFITFQMTCHAPSRHVLSAECAKPRAPLKESDHGYAHAWLVWIALDTYDCWIILDLLRILKNGVILCGKSMALFYRGKTEAQKGATGTPERGAIAAHCFR